MVKSNSPGDESTIKTRYFNENEENELAEMAEKAADRPMGDTTRGKFDELLNDAAIAFTVPASAQTPTLVKDRKRIASFESRMRDLAKEVNSYVGGKLQWPVQVGPLIDLADWLRDLNDSSEARRGRPPSDGRFAVLVLYLSDVWELGAGRKAGTSSDREGTRRRGPFVDFVQAAAEFLEPGQAELSDRIYAALRHIKETLPSGGR